MKKIRSYLVLGALLALPGWAAAATPTTVQIQPLLDANGCSSCHERSERLVGPAFDDVAKKYGGDVDAAALLSKKVRNGGTGVWGQVEMPPNTRISDADLARVVDWVLHGGAKAP